MTDEDANLLHYMPIIVRGSTVTDWERKFCASIIHRSRQKNFSPSAKQREVMQRIVGEFKDAMMRDDTVTADEVTPHWSEETNWQPLGAAGGRCGRAKGQGRSRLSCRPGRSSRRRA